MISVKNEGVTIPYNVHLQNWLLLRFQVLLLSGLWSDDCNPWICKLENIHLSNTENRYHAVWIKITKHLQTQCIFCRYIIASLGIWSYSRLLHLAENNARMWFYGCASIYVAALIRCIDSHNMNTHTLHTQKNVKNEKSWFVNEEKTRFYGVLYRSLSFSKV